MSKNQLRFNLLIFFIAVSICSAMGRYTVYELKGPVQIKQGTQTLKATTGMEVKPSDLFIIPDYSCVKILDSRNSQIYESTSSGQMSVTRIIFDASKKASNKRTSVNDKLRMGRGNEKSGVVLVEKGKVTRVLNTFDPTAEDMQLDVNQLSLKVYNILCDSILSISPTHEDSPIVIRHQRSGEDGLTFMVENTMPFPIYFNVIKQFPENKDFEISELGQPVGSYALQPDQSIARTQRTGLDPYGSHYLIVTNYYFDVDELLTNLNRLRTQGIPSDTVVHEFPLLMHKL